jgi:DNA-directed RNA polymerase specialized sigma24 family protein
MEIKTDKPPDDPDSFDRQIQRPELRARLIKLARRKGVPETDCEDVASDIIAEAIRCQAEYDRERGSVSTWVIAIGENVIRTYVRRLTAQKRKPEGGIISSDAASDPDANPLKVRDTRAEAERRSSEEAEHFLDTARLSKKERKAVALHRNKEANEISEKFSSSTARRAMKKLKQAGTDEKFRECARGPDALECAYGKIAPPEHDTALLYDAARRISWFVDAIAQWRNSPEWKQLKLYLDNQRDAKRFPLSILREHWPDQLSRYRQAAHERDPRLRQRFEAAIEVAVAFPEWPYVGYCRLEPNERRERLEQFGWHVGREPFWEIDERTFEFFVSAADDLPDPKVGLSAFLQQVNEAPLNASHTYSSVYLVRIDRRYPLKTLAESFTKWARAKLQATPKTIIRSGRRRTTRLVGFACVRLMDEFGLTKAEAMSWLKAHFGGLMPFTPERLERAARATRDSLKHFLPSPAEIGV